MERIIFNCYIKWLHGKNGNLFARVLKLPLTAKILMALLFTTLIGVVITVLTNSELTICFLAAEVLISLVVYLYTDHYEIKYSDDELDNFREHCEAFKKILDSTGINITEEFVIDLKKRYIDKVNTNKLRVANNRTTLGKWVMALLIPIILALFGAIVNPEASINDVLTLGLSIVSLILLVFFVAFFVIEIVNLCIMSKNGEYQQLIDDLQGAVDFKLCTDCDEIIKTKFDTVKNS